MLLSALLVRVDREAELLGGLIACPLRSGSYTAAGRSMPAPAPSSSDAAAAHVMSNLFDRVSLSLERDWLLIGVRSRRTSYLGVSRYAAAPALAPMSVVKLAAESDARRGTTAGAIVAAVLALGSEPRFARTMTTESSGSGVAASSAGSPDTASQAWVARLSCSGPEREAAVTELHALLLRAARFEIRRRRAAFPQLSGADLDDLAWQSADDALMSILRRLGDFRGDSQFTTWACKFAIVEAGAKVRRHAWRGREVPLSQGLWAAVADDAPGPHQHAEAQDLLRALREEVGLLTGRQRQVFVAVALNDVPIDVLAERLNTTRGALYKTLHDTRRKLRAALAARGLGIEGQRR